MGKNAHLWPVQNDSKHTDHQELLRCLDSPTGNFRAHDDTTDRQTDDVITKVFARELALKLAGSMRQAKLNKGAVPVIYRFTRVTLCY